jgi:tetratricopeptide (TPR) repeat protein
MRLLSLNSVPFSFRTLSVLTGGLMLFAGPVNSSSAFPNPKVEAHIVRELLAVESKISQSKQIGDVDERLAYIATSLARLGRLEASLRVAGNVDRSQYEEQYTRAEVLRLVVRRRCMFGKVEEARRLIPAIAVSDSRTDALLALSRAYIRRGEHEAARQALYQVSNLLVEKPMPDSRLQLSDQKIRAMSYTASLLAKTGDLYGAKRLFARAEQQLKLLISTQPSKPGDVTRVGMRGQDERTVLSRYMFNAGLIDEAIRIEETIGEGLTEAPYSRFLSAEQLARANRFDDALRVARAYEGYRGVMSRGFLATLISKRKKDHERATKVLDETLNDCRRLGTTLEESNKPIEEAVGGVTVQQMAIVILSEGYREVGQEERAQQLFEEAIKGMERKGEAFLRIYTAMLDLAYAGEEKKPIPLVRLREIDALVKAQLPFLDSSQQTHGIINWLAREFIQRKQLDIASTYLDRMEQATFPLNNTSQAFSAMDLVNNWRKAGNEQRAQTVLQKIYRMPLKTAENRQDLAQIMFSFGFLEEGRRVLGNLPLRRRHYFQAQAIGCWEAKHQPHIFPARITKIADHRARLNELLSFTNGLTIPIYETPEEREFVLSRGGYSSSF